MSTMPTMRLMGRISLLMYGLMSAVAAGTITPILPKISDEFHDGANGVYIKMVATALGLGMLFGAPLAGFLADRFGRKPVMTCTTVLYAVAGCSVFFSTELWQVIVARFFVGVGLGGLGTAVIATIGDHFDDKDRSRWLGYVTATAAIFVLPIYPIVGYIADQGWRGSFLIYAISMITLSCVLLGFTSDRPRPGATAEAKAAPSAAYHIPWNVIAVSMAIGIISTGTSLYIPFRFREVGLTSSGEISLYLLPSVFVAGLMAFCYGYFRRYISVHTVFLISALASCIGLAIASLAPHPAIVTLGMILESFAVGVSVPNASMYALANSTVEYRARTIGITKGAIFGSPFAAQFVLERISQIGGASLALMAISAVGGIVALGFMIRRVSGRGLVVATVRT